MILYPALQRLLYHGYTVLNMGGSNGDMMGRWWHAAFAVLTLPQIETIGGLFSYPFVDRMIKGSGMRRIAFV
jgi:hypothetical protein